MPTKRKALIISGTLLGVFLCSCLFIFVTNSIFPKKEVPTIKEANIIAENWIKNFSASFPYYGKDLQVKTEKEIEKGVYDFIFSFVSEDSDYGIRENEMEVRVDGLEVVKAVTNEIFNEIDQKYIEKESTIDVYFVVQKEGEEEVFESVKRVISSSVKDKLEELAVIELLKGPTQEEEEMGISTSIEKGTELLSLNIEKRVAYLDFNLDISEAGEKQLLKTISQFGTIEEIKAPVKREVLVVNVEGVPTSFLFRKDLQEGTKSEDVKYLQVILNADPETKVAESGAGSPGKEITSFGPATRRALMNFQRKYADEILEPAGLILSTGIVDIYTRDKLNTILEENRLRTK
jgi:hypothetical protein